MSERLQKVLARGGLGSRRKCEELIASGRVRVNGKVAAEPGIRVDPVNDEVTIDGVPVETERSVYYLLHKPKGFVCTNRPRADEQAAVALVRAPEGQRLFTVGRLDEDSSGALLVTNDGAWANLLTHPRYGVPKTYRVTVRGRAEGDLLSRIREGIHLSEGKTAPSKVHVTKRSREWSALRVTLHEGKNRHLRRVFARIGLPVQEILRVAIGSIRLGKLKPGEYRPLLRDEIEVLRAEASAPAPREAARPRRPRARDASSGEGEAAAPEVPPATPRKPRAGGRRPGAFGRSGPSKRSGSADRSGRARREGRSDRSGPPDRSGRSDHPGRPGPRPKKRPPKPRRGGR